uniref:FHA domain-containing protein n=1 Tax=Aplanochytrium stocchinoi TaxID=215587 RepID=A0A7S3PQM4_9STRA
MPNRRRVSSSCAILQSKGRENWRVPLRCKGEKSVYTIGRHPNCSLQLSDMHISSKHLTISCRYKSSDSCKEDRDHDGDENDDEANEDSDQVVIELTDTSSNGTWLNGEKLERGRPVLLKSGSEVSFPCDEPLQADYTFIIHIPSVEEDTDTACIGSSTGGGALSSYGGTHTKADKDWNHQFSEQWKEVQKQENELILNVSRLAARVYACNDTISKHQQISAVEEENEERNVLVEKTPPTVSFKEFETGMNELLLANKNTVQVLRSMFDSMKLARNEILLCESMTEDDRASILNKLDTSRWEAVMRAISE